MTTFLIGLNVALAALVFTAMVAFLSRGIRDDRRFVLAMHRRGARRPLHAHAHAHAHSPADEASWRQAA